MKKLLFAALALLFAACTTDLTRDVVITPTNTLTIGVENNDTRIELLDGRTVWSTGDFVSVYYNSNANQKWQFTGQTGDRLGTLEYVSAPWETKSFDDIIIAYPYSEDYRLITATGAIEATLPDVQNYSPESYGLGSSMMVCVGTKPEETFLLKSVCGWLKLQLTGNGNCVEKIVLYGNNKEQVAGSIYVNPADATAILAAQGAEDAGDNTVGGVLIMDDKIYREVTLYCPTGGVQLSDKATDFYIALPPQTFSQGFTVNAHCTNGEVIPLSTNKPTTIERNTILPMAAINCGYNWIDVGVCTYTEDLFNSWFGFSIPPLNVKVQVRADSIDKDAFAAALAGTGSDEGLAGIYRMVNPYDEIKGIIDGLYVYDANIEIHALDIYQVDIPHQEIGVNLDTGGVVAPATIISVTPGTIKNGILSFEEKSLAGIPGGIYTDVYTCNYNAKWSLNIAPELNIYELPVGNDTKDFRFEPVELSENTLFYSQALKKSWKATLEKGYPITPDANKDKRFAEQYGTLYRLPNLYAEGYHIYFCIKDGVGVIPYQYRKQKCGIVYSYDSDYIMLYDEDQRTNISFDEANNRLIFNTTRFHNASINFLNFFLRFLSI